VGQKIAQKKGPAAKLPIPKRVVGSFLALALRANIAGALTPTIVRTLFATTSTGRRRGLDCIGHNHSTKQNTREHRQTNEYTFHFTISNRQGS